MRIFPRRRRNLDERDALRVQRSVGIRGVLGVVAVILLVVVGFIASMVVLSPLFELNNLREEKGIALKQLEQAQREEKMAQDRYHWMMDPEYFEQVARDRANMAKDGETVIRRPSPQDEEPAPAPRGRD